MLNFLQTFTVEKGVVVFSEYMKVNKINVDLVMRSTWLCWPELDKQIGKLANAEMKYPRAAV